MGKWRLTKHWVEAFKSTFSLNMNHALNPLLSSFLTQSFCSFPWHRLSPATDLWPASIQHYLPLPTWASLSLNLSSAELPPFIPCFSMFQCRLSSIFVTWLIVCWWLDRGRKRGMMKCCLQELLTDNSKISISVFFFKTIRKAYSICREHILQKPTSLKIHAGI